MPDNVDVLDAANATVPIATDDVSGVLAALRGVILTRETAAPFVVSEDRARPLVVSTDIAAPAIITTDSVRVRRG